MAEIIPKRMTAEIEGDFVVFLIGMRINKLWKIHKWLPAFLAMPRMLRELERHPESGFLGHTMGLPVIVQYWRSFEDLEAYARSQDHQHWPAWVAFNKRIGQGRGDVGIWHDIRWVCRSLFNTGVPSRIWRPMRAVKIINTGQPGLLSTSGLAKDVEMSGFGMRPFWFMKATVYSGMSPIGLGKVGTLVAASGRRESASGRLSVDGSSKRPTATLSKEDRQDDLGPAS